MELIGNVETFIPELFKLDRDKKYQLDIKEYRKKRSKNANSYLWALINEIGNVVKLDKEEIYLNMLKHYGQSDLFSVKAGIDVNGYFKYYEVAGTSLLNDNEFVHYKVYKGSSEYDTREMSVLLDGVIQECNQLGIPTISEEELKRLKGEWISDKKV